MSRLASRAASFLAVARARAPDVPGAVRTVPGQLALGVALPLAAVEVVLVDRVAGVAVAVVTAAEDRVDREEAAGRRGVQPDAHERLAGHGLRGPLLGAQPAIAGHLLARAGVAVLVGVERSRGDGGVQGQLERHVTVDGGEMEHRVAGRARRGGQTAGEGGTRCG